MPYVLTGVAYQPRIGGRRRGFEHELKAKNEPDAIIESVGFINAEKFHRDPPDYEKLGELMWARLMYNKICVQFFPSI